MPDFSLWIGDLAKYRSCRIRSKIRGMLHDKKQHMNFINLVGFIHINLKGCIFENEICLII